MLYDVITDTMTSSKLVLPSHVLRVPSPLTVPDLQRPVATATVAVRVCHVD
jgi:hypothetical protein